MARSLKAASQHKETAAAGGWLARLVARIRRRRARIVSLNERMLRDIGLGERELRQNSRRKWP
jgi:hypothetical protein